MNGEIIEITNGDTTHTRGKYFEGKNAHGRTVIALPGLGGTTSAEMITAISRQVEAIGNFSLFAFDHPHFGMNATDVNPETFSLEQCERNASNAVNHVLSLPNTERVVLIGSSLGFWSFFQILSKEAQGNRSKILALLGKSGIASYIKVLYRFLDQCGANGNYEDESAWNKLLGNYQVNRQTGWGKLTVNSGDQPVPIHENFFRSIPGYNEGTTTKKRVEAIHGQKDKYTSLDEMLAHNGGNIVVDIEADCHHDLNGSRADEKLIWRASSLLN